MVGLQKNFAFKGRPNYGFKMAEKLHPFSITNSISSFTIFLTADQLIKIILGDLKFYIFFLNLRLIFWAI